MDDVFVRYLALPSTVRGATVLDENGDYNVYINKDLSYDQQQRTLKHEMEHIRRDDFNRDADIREIENLD